MGGSDNKGDGLASQPRRHRVPGQPLLNRHQVGGVSRIPDGLFAQQVREPIRGRPTVRGKSTYGGRPGQRVDEQGTWASQKHSEAGYGRPVDRGVWTAKTVKRPRQQPAGPWTVTRSSLRMLRRVAAFCRPLRPVLLLVSFPRSRSPVVGVLGLCWMWHGVLFARHGAQ